MGLFLFVVPEGTATLTAENFVAIIDCRRAVLPQRGSLHKLLLHADYNRYG